SILLPFYDDLQAWLDDGCPDNQIFDQRTGLCETLKRWARLSHIKYINIPHPILKNELEHQFETAHLCKRIPFNKDVKEYWKELSLGAIYQNPHRVAWINKHASKTLKQFYREIQAWIDDGCPVHDVFDQSTALCETL